MEKKEVKKSTPKEVKRIFLLNHIIAAIQDGKYPSQIAKELDISKQSLSFYIRQMKKEGIIEKLGYGVWEVKKEVKKSTKDTLSLEVKKQVRGHAFIWKVKINKVPEFWSSRIEILQKKGIQYKLVGIKETPRIIINNKKTWLGNKGIVIYDSSSFFAENSIESKKLAVSSLLETLRELEEKLNLDLKPYTFTTNREHFALIKNLLAIQCNREGEKIKVYDKGEKWLVVDDSLGEGGELENEGKKALILNKQMQGWWNDNKDHKFQVTPSFVLNTMNGIQQNQLIFDRNMKSHIQAIKDLGSGVNKLTELVERLKEK